MAEDLNEILKGLGLGDKVHMGAFVLSFALRVVAINRPTSS